MTPPTPTLTRSRNVQTFLDKTVDIGRFRFGISHDLVELPEGNPYLERWILWLGITIRVHKFWRGDDERAPHDHPWAFVTIPLNRGYYEKVSERNVFDREGATSRIRFVSRWRPHFRPASHRHIVVMPEGATPIWTFVVTGLRNHSWGFWPTPTTFVPWREWPAAKDQENRPW